MKPDLDPTGKSGSIYLHIPFCQSKCAYCAFNSYPARHFDINGYLEALEKEIAAMATHPLIRQKKFVSLFIGGGTPTIYSGRQLGRLIRSCRKLYHFTDRPEISVETNPNQISLETLNGLKEAGVNRLSIGIQSFAAPLLKKLGRTHTVEDGLKAIDLARKAGFDNINLDLMYGLPGQNTQNWQQTLETALATDPEHLAIYELMVEKNTAFATLAAANKLELPHEDTIVHMEKLTLHVLSAGFIRYEIANYARPGYECQHNINYWKNGTYLGLGAGAVSCLNNMRISHVPDPDHYRLLITNDKSPFAGTECLCRQARFRETIIMGLRMTGGVDMTDLESRFGLTPSDYYGPILKNFIDRNLLEISGDHLRLTERSLPIANQVLSELV
ncbi:MAG: radical SAM family heme chaperone HemW [Thermodesulfobacteriota bacterium]|nr:radical SAM family heme chaperone HemW [Thermodesulfobacteriota bacterium]